MSAQFNPSRQPNDVEMLRVPPHDTAAEQSVLGGLMIDPDSLVKISDWLAEADFYRKDHRLIFRAINHLSEKGSPVDTLTVMDWFDANGLSEIIGGSSYLYELNSATPSSANIVAYAEIVAEHSRLRSVINAGSAMVESAYNRKADSQLIIADSVNDLSAMQSSKLRGGLEPAKVAMKKFGAQIMERYSRGPGLIGDPWPWKALNERTNGLRDGTLYIVGGRPSMGKSIFGLQTAINSAMAGRRTAFFSIEMGAEECMGRATACVGRIPHNWVDHPTDEDPDAQLYWSRLTDTMQRITDSPLIIDETPALSSRQLVARANRAHMQAPLRLIVIDHMHDMDVDAKNARFDYGKITQDAKSMAKRFRCPVILLAQLNREASKRNDKRPTLTDLRESGEIEAKGDVILFLHREDYYTPGSMSGAVEIIPAKGRNIRVGDPIILQNVFSEMRMDDWIGPLPVREEIQTHRGMR
jgi:replicative DNA helicase